MKQHFYNHGYGKIILCGEHFVVQGFPAIACALPLSTHAYIKSHPTKELILNDQRPHPYAAWQNVSKHQEYYDMAVTLCNACNVPAEYVNITLQGTLPVTTGGIGSSAAAAVAIVHALNEYTQQNLSLHDINERAFQGETIIHGNPSGIDNTTATFGSIIRYTKHQPHHIISSPNPLFLVIADSGRPTHIKRVMHALNTFQHQNTHATNALFSYYESIYRAADQALIAGDMPTLGNLMTLNHHLLKELSLSSPELDFLVNLSIKHGALGAKLTGTGCGGIMIALAKNQHDQQHIQRAISDHGFFTLTQTIHHPQPQQQTYYETIQA